MNSVKEAFNANFEQVGYDQEPEFQIHGIGYQGKWGKDTMSMFLKDLEEVEEFLNQGKDEGISKLKEKVENLESELREVEEGE